MFAYSWARQLAVAIGVRVRVGRCPSVLDLRPYDGVDIIQNRRPISCDVFID